MRDIQDTNPPRWFRFLWVFVVTLFILLSVYDIVRADDESKDCVEYGETDYGPQKKCEEQDKDKEEDGKDK